MFENNITTLWLKWLKRDNKSVQLSNYSFCSNEDLWNGRMYSSSFSSSLLDKYMDIEEWEKLESQNMNSNNFKL